MNDHDKEQIPQTEGLSRSAKKNRAWLDEQDTLELSDEHVVHGKVDEATQHSDHKTGNSVLKTVFWVLRKLIAPIVMVIMLLAGLYIGYVVVAGQSSDDVFKFETWKHLWDLVFADS